jgi:hypothetical protein
MDLLTLCDPNAYPNKSKSNITTSIDNSVSARQVFEGKTEDGWRNWIAVIESGGFKREVKTSLKDSQIGNQ